MTITTAAPRRKDCNSKKKHFDVTTNNKKHVIDLTKPVQIDINGIQFFNGYDDEAEIKDGQYCTWCESTGRINSILNTSGVRAFCSFCTKGKQGFCRWVATNVRKKLDDVIQFYNQNEPWSRRQQRSLVEKGGRIELPDWEMTSQEDALESMKKAAMSQQKTIEDRAHEKREMWFPSLIVSTYTSQCTSGENERKPYFHVRLVADSRKKGNAKPRFLFKLRICTATSLLSEYWTDTLIQHDYTGEDALFRIFQRLRIMREIMTEEARENFSEKHLQECANKLYFR